MKTGEFAWNHADPRKGVVSAALHGLKYLVLPLVVIIMGLTFLDREDGPRSIVALMQEMQTLVLVFGLALLVLGFFRGAYPKGSYSRLAFGMAVTVLAIFYAFSLLLDGRLQAEIADRAFELDLQLLFVLYFVGAIFSVFLQLAEFIDHRRLWLEGSEQIAPLDKEDPKDHLWYHDFRLRYGSLFNGLKLSRRTLVGYVIIPIALIIVLKAAFSSIDMNELDTVMSSLDRVYAFMLILGLPLTLLAFFKGFYPKGSFSRFLPALAMVLISIYWIWILGLEGEIIIEIADFIEIGLDYSALLLLIICGTALWIVYYALELWLYRPEWKNGGFQKDVVNKRPKMRWGRKKTEEVEGEMTEVEVPAPQESSEP